MHSHNWFIPATSDHKKLTVQLSCPFPGQWVQSKKILCLYTHRNRSQGSTASLVPGAHGLESVLFPVSCLPHLLRCSLCVSADAIPLTAWPSVYGLLFRNLPSECDLKHFSIVMPCSFTSQLFSFPFLYYSIFDL